MADVRTSRIDQRVLIVGVALLAILGLAYLTSSPVEMTPRARVAWWWETTAFGYRKRCGANQPWSPRLRVTAVDLPDARQYLAATHPTCALSPPFGERRAPTSRIAPPLSR